MRRQPVTYCWSCINCCGPKRPSTLQAWTRRSRFRYFSRRLPSARKPWQALAQNPQMRLMTGPVSLDFFTSYFTLQSPKTETTSELRSTRSFSVTPLTFTEQFEHAGMEAHKLLLRADADQRCRLVRFSQQPIHRMLQPFVQCPNWALVEEYCPDLPRTHPPPPPPPSQERKKKENPPPADIQTHPARSPGRCGSPSTRSASNHLLLQQIEQISEMAARSIACPSHRPRRIWESTKTRAALPERQFRYGFCGQNNECWLAVDDRGPPRRAIAPQSLEEGWFCHPGLPRMSTD